MRYSAIRFVCFLVPVALLAAAGCGPKVLHSSEPRPPTNPADVEFYAEQPKEYYDLGEIKVTKDVKYDANFGADTVGDELKALAAAKGANGVLLRLKDRPNKTYVGGFYKGTYYLFPIQNQPRAALGEAMYVTKKK